jgi:class 3 adenylate cyclase
MRGTGLSGGVADWSIESQVRDLDALIDHLELEKVALVGPPFGGPVAIAYAARYPERVSHLILWCSWARTWDAMDSSQGKAILALLEQDWEVFTEMLSYMISGYDSASEAHELAISFRQSVKQEQMRAYIAAFLEFDVTDLLARVQTPTLILQSRTAVLPSLEAAQRMASRIPNARFGLVEGSAVPWAGDMEANARAFDEFLGDSPDPVTETPPVQSPSGTAIILFADIVDSTALTETMGDAAFREKARALDTAMRAAIRANGGTAVEGKTLGDGVLAIFTSAKQAIACAQACHAAATTAGLELHAGIHAGDVIREADNVYGGAVNIAARVAAASAAGETLVSATVRELARTSAGVSFEDRGEQALKGIDDPVRVWAVREA